MNIAAVVLGLGVPSGMAISCLGIISTAVPGLAGIKLKSPIRNQVGVRFVASSELQLAKNLALYGAPSSGEL